MIDICGTVHGPNLILDDPTDRRIVNTSIIIFFIYLTVSERNMFASYNCS